MLSSQRLHFGKIYVRIFFGDFMKKITALFICLLLLLLPLNIGAAAQQSTEITNQISFTAAGFSSVSALSDGKDSSYVTAKGDATITLTSPSGVSIAGIYILFDKQPEPYEATAFAADGASNSTTADKEFIHQYLDVSSFVPAGKSAQSVSLSFKGGTAISEIYVFTNGTLPEWVQIWDSPCEEADLFLLTTHADDEQLFFAGTLPYYSALGYAVQVAYVTDHYDSHTRQHERLNGLWTAGIKNYPVFGGFADQYSESLEGAIKNLERTGKNQQNIIDFLTKEIRRCKPLVIMGQDFEGEYGHGQHMLATDSLVKAIAAAADSTVITDNLSPYDTPKTYIHLYPENKIALNYDEPLEQLAGRTPFEVSQAAFKCHKSQLYTWFNKWLCGKEGSPITKASQITTYSPLDFGLYRTTVGPDSGINDLFENVTPYFMRQKAEPEPEPQPEAPRENGSSNSIYPPIAFAIAAALIILAIIFIKIKGKKGKHN